MDRKIKIIDGVLEMSLRVLFIIYIYNNVIDKERIIIYDYLSCNNKLPSSNLTYIGLQKTINESLQLLLSRQLISCKVDRTENMYLLSKLGKAFVSELLKESYAEKLSKNIKQVDTLLHNLNKEQISRHLNIHI